MKALALARTIVFQRLVKKMEDALNGHFRSPLQNNDALASEFEKAVSKEVKIKEALERRQWEQNGLRFRQCLAQLDALKAIYN